MKIPNKVIKKYQDVYYKDMSQFTEEEWKRYYAMLNDIAKHNGKEEENEHNNKKRKEELSFGSYESTNA